MISTPSSRKVLLPARLESGAIPSDAFNLYFNWLERSGATFDPQSSPWLPMGHVGPIMILAHSAPASALEPAWPAWIAQYVTVSTADYDKLHAMTSHRADSNFPSWQVPDLALPENRPTLVSAEAVVELLLNGFILREAEREALIALQSKGAAAQLPSDAPDGLAEAIQFLRNEAIQLIDPRGIAFKDDLMAMVPASSGGVVAAGFAVDAQNVAYFAASRIRNELIDGIAARRRCLRRDVRLALAPPAILAAVIHERAERQSKNQFQKAGAATAKATPDLSEQHIILDEAELSGLKLDDVTLESQKLFHLVLYTAIKAGASDIHFEELKGRGHIRIRVDGSLRSLCMPSLEAGRGLIGVAKNGIIQGFSTTNFGTEDASSSIRLGRQVVNVRANLIPTKSGYQTLVIRLLPKQSALLNLGNLGLPKRSIQLLRHAINRPSGLIVVTGPTGSGKTTTLYACLTEVNKPDIRIQTMEDPVEIELEGATQSAVDDKRSVSFGSLLRASLRQDPDVILVGEVRDSETARLCLKAASTGHLVFTTLHANSETEAVTRMMDLIDDPKQLPVLASSTILLQSQRLIGRLCKRCRVLVDPVPPDVATLFERNEIKCQRYYSANLAGCPDCYQGYSGRMAIMALLPITTEIAASIARGANAFDLRTAAEKAGFSSLYKEALGRVAEGETSLEEARTWEDHWAAFSF